MRKIFFLISISLLLKIDMQAQIDTLKVENTLKKVVKAFEDKSFEDFKALLLSKENYLKLVYQAGRTPSIDIDEFEAMLNKSYEELEMIFFNPVLVGVEERGESWEDIRYDGFVFEVEEKMLNTHIRISFKEKNYAILGIQLWLIDDEYKIESKAIDGIYEMYLEDYSSADEVDEVYVDEEIDFIKN